MAINRRTRSVLYVSIATCSTNFGDNGGSRHVYKISRHIHENFSLSFTSFIKFPNRTISFPCERRFVTSCHPSNKRQFVSDGPQGHSRQKNPAIRVVCLRVHWSPPDKPVTLQISIGAYIVVKYVLPRGSKFKLSTGPKQRKGGAYFFPLSVNKSSHIYCYDWCVKVVPDRSRRCYVYTTIWIWFLSK